MMFNPFKTLTRKLLWKSGFKIYTRHSLPMGNLVSKDLHNEHAQKPFQVIFDVGANVGQAAFQLREMFPKSCIYSFEPITTVFEELKKNFQRDVNFFPYKLALGAQKKWVDVFLQSKTRYHSLSEGLNIPDPETQNRKECVEVVTLNDFCKEHNIEQIDFLKIDAEGFDLEVLKGSKALLEHKKIRCIFIEVGFNPDLDPRYTSFFEVNEFLKPYGYRLRSIYHQSTNERSYLAYADALFCLKEDA